jgi:hypothetical protein
MVSSNMYNKKKIDQDFIKCISFVFSKPDAKQNFHDIVESLYIYIYINIIGTISFGSHYP